MLRHPGLTAFLMLTAIVPAWADAPGKAPPGSYGWVGGIIAIVLVLGVIIASMTGSRRGHQD